MSSKNLRRLPSGASSKETSKEQYHSQSSKELGNSDGGVSKGSGSVSRKSPGKSPVDRQKSPAEKSDDAFGDLRRWSHEAGQNSSDD